MVSDGSLTESTHGLDIEVSLVSLPLTSLSANEGLLQSLNRGA